VLVQDSVQRKLRWIKNNANSWIWYWPTGHGAGYKFPFPLNYITIGKARRIHSRSSAISSCHLCCTNTIGVVIFTPRLGEVLQFKKDHNFSLLVLLVRL
jgi:hypothetical protein